MKTYEELKQERDELKGQLDQYADMKGRSTYQTIERQYKEKQHEIKQWIKSHPKHH